MKKNTTAIPTAASAIKGLIAPKGAINPKLKTENNDKALETLVKCHEENPVGFDDDKDFQKRGLTTSPTDVIISI